MTTHRRAWMLRAGVVATTALGALTGVAAPALAAPTVSASNVTIESGGDQRPVTVKVTAAAAEPVSNAEISLEGLPSGVSCVSGCGEKFNVNAGQQVSRTIYVKSNAGSAEGDSSVTVRVTTGPPDNFDTSSTFTIKVVPKAPPTIGTISGKVKDSVTGKAIAGALVMIQDSAGYQDTVTTGDTGTFSFRGTTTKPIKPGAIGLGVTMEGYGEVVKTYTLAAGQSKTGISISMVSTATPTASALPSDTGEPTDTTEPTDGTGETDPDTTPVSEESGGLSWILIAIGGLLVALGIGAIVLMIIRRNNDDDEDEDDDEEDEPPARGPRSPAGARGGGTYGAPRGADPTMISRPGMNDAPTSLQRPGQYGAPAQGGWSGYGQEAQPTQTYGSPGGAYGSPAGGAYGSPAGGTYGGGAGAGGAYAGPAGGAYGSPVGGGYQGGGPYGSPAAPTSGYGGAAPSSGGGYGAPGYEDPTARYGGQPSYDPPPATHGQPGYDQAGYPAQQGGYQQQGGYGQPGYAAGGYEAPQPGGYGGYVPEPRGGGYDDQGAYDHPTQRAYGQDAYGQQPPYDDRRGEPRDRRQLDWLDD